MVRKQQTKVNIKARLNRHLRIVKENILIDKASNSNNHKLQKHSSFHYNVVLFFVLLIIPIYPTLASLVYNTSTYDFYRWDIDETTILESYYWWESDDEVNLEVPIIETQDSFISINIILDDERDLEWTNEIVEYEVKPGESFYSISYKFKVSTNSIYWANDFSKKHILQPWDIIKVPPVTWLIHQVTKEDTIARIAKKYETPEEKIRKQNLLEEEDVLAVWEVLVIPWAVKKVAKKPVYKAPSNIKSNKKSWGWYTFAKYAQSQYVSNKWQYKLVRRKPQHTFYWWNCTRYVAQYKNVNWWGNANQWIRNAKKKWHMTWVTPKIWAIIQFNGRWYNPRYGHVWIVMDITQSDIIVSDMNYRRLNEVTYRKIPVRDRSIEWYIYVD